VPAIPKHGESQCENICGLVQISKGKRICADGMRMLGAAVVYGTQKQVQGAP
jgi:hypothetical protein